MGNMDKVLSWMTGLLVLGVLAVIILVFVGNLSGNLGFTAGSQGDNDTRGVINNLSSGVLTFAGFFGTSFTAVAIFLILGIFIALLGLVLSLRKKMGGSGSGGFGG